MRIRSFTAALAVVIPLLLSACGENPANTTVSGTVESAKSYGPRSIMSKIFSSPYYLLTVKSDQGETWSVSIADWRIDYNDVSRTISERVTVTCHRDDSKAARCSARTLVLNGRELTRAR